METTALVKYDDGGGEVHEGAGCPRCGERRTDYLVIAPDEETAWCATCARPYMLP